MDSYFLGNYEKAEVDAAIELCATQWAMAIEEAGGKDGNVLTLPLEINGEKTEIKIYSQHAYTVKACSNEYVTLVNPHDSSKDLVIPILYFRLLFNAVYTN